MPDRAPHKAQVYISMAIQKSGTWCGVSQSRASVDRNPLAGLNLESKKHSCASAQPTSMKTTNSFVNLISCQLTTCLFDTEGFFSSFVEGVPNS